MDSYEPEHPHLKKVWQRLSPEARRKRWEEAKRRERILKLVAGRPDGQSERAAVRELVKTAPELLRQDGQGRIVPVDRSGFRRWKERCRLHGFDGLLDWRRPPVSPMPEEVRSAICTMRRMDPEIRVERICQHVLEHHGYKASTTKVKRVLLVETDAPMG